MNRFVIMKHLPPLSAVGPATVFFLCLLFLSNSAVWAYDELRPVLIQALPKATEQEAAQRAANKGNEVSGRAMKDGSEDKYGDVTEEEIEEPGLGMPGGPGGEYGDVKEEELEKEEVVELRVSDPLEPVNRATFKFNDRMYFWVFKPVATGYRKVVPEDFRVIFSNFYKNLFSPIRIVNNFLQFKMRNTGTEIARLVINSTVGVGGLRDIGRDCFGITAHEEDFGQTLGFYGLKPGFYVVWPVLGPSSARDSVGMGGDFLLNPLTWAWTYPAFGLGIHNRINILSFQLGDYEALKKAAIDPYISVRNAYYQNRQAQIAK